MTSFTPLLPDAFSKFQKFLFASYKKYYKDLVCPRNAEIVGHLYYNQSLQTKHL